MKDRVSLFNLRFSDGRTIGPEALRRLWSEACGSRDVAVSRTTFESAGRPGHRIYTLSGPRSMAGLDAVELRLRTLMRDRVAGSVVKLTRLA
ncbi:MAG: hypothetical protein WBW61_01930 [Rhodanobacteraceae bacterium]